MPRSPRSPLQRQAIALLGALFAIAAMAAVLAPPARAECKDVRWETRWQPDPFGTSGGSLVSVPVCHDPAPAAERKKKKSGKRKQPTRAQLRALRFRPSEDVSALVRQRMIEQLAHGEQAEQIRAHIESDEPMRQFEANLRAEKWSPRDVGDMYSAAYITMWMVANERTTLKKVIAEAVRRQLRRRLALDPKVRRAGDAAQQELGEWFGSWTASLAGSMTYLQTLGDPVRVAEYREKVRVMLMAPDLFDKDLTKVRLTRRGIRRR